MKSNKQILEGERLEAKQQETDQTQSLNLEVEVLEERVAPMPAGRYR